MSLNPLPLRYRISSWRQLPQCLSNNSRSLHIHTTDFVQDCGLHGFRITVEHDIYGVLFACVLNARGPIVSRINNTPEDYLDDPISYEPPVHYILKSLEKYGFLVDFNPREHLCGSLLQYLMTLRDLHYDKIRLLPVWKLENGCKQFKTQIVAFKSSSHVPWLNNDYDASESEFTKSLVDGTAINLTDISATQKYQWNWLDYVGNIDDIIRDNAEDSIYGD